MRLLGYIPKGPDGRQTRPPFFSKVLERSGGPRLEEGEEAKLSSLGLGDSHTKGGGEGKDRIISKTRTANWGNSTIQGKQMGSQVASYGPKFPVGKSTGGRQIRRGRC